MKWLPRHRVMGRLQRREPISQNPSLFHEVVVVTMLVLTIPTIPRLHVRRLVPCSSSQQLHFLSMHSMQVGILFEPLVPNLPCPKLRLGPALLLPYTERSCCRYHVIEQYKLLRKTYHRPKQVVEDEDKLCAPNQTRYHSAIQNTLIEFFIYQQAKLLLSRFN